MDITAGSRARFDATKVEVGGLSPVIGECGGPGDGDAGVGWCAAGLAEHAGGPLGVQVEVDLDPVKINAVEAGGHRVPCLMDADLVIQGTVMHGGPFPGSGVQEFGPLPGGVVLNRVCPSQPLSPQKFHVLRTPPTHLASSPSGSNHCTCGAMLPRRRTRG